MSCCNNPEIGFITVSDLDGYEQNNVMKNGAMNPTQMSTLRK